CALSAALLLVGCEIDDTPTDGGDGGSDSGRDSGKTDGGKHDGGDGGRDAGGSDGDSGVPPAPSDAGPAPVSCTSDGDCTGLPSDQTLGICPPPWSLLSESPSPRGAATASYDARRKRLVVHGGMSIGDQRFETDTWALPLDADGGTAWIPLSR